MKWGLAPIPSTWDNLGQLIPCTNQGRGKVGLKELGFGAEGPQDWSWLIWEGRGELGPSAGMGRIPAPPGLQLEGRAQLDGPRCQAESPSVKSRHWPCERNRTL